MARVLLIFLIFCFSVGMAHSVMKGSVDYLLPTDYTKFNQSELEFEATFYYNVAISSKEVNEEMTTALNMYTILTNIDPTNITYILKLGKLYDVLQKDRLAKGNYYRAMDLDKNRPEPYFYLGDYFYNREQYKRALKFYMLAYDNGYSNHFQTLYKIGDIYQKLGDTRNSIKYLQSAYDIYPDIEVSAKLKQVEEADINNKDFYRR